MLKVIEPMRSGAEIFHHRGRKMVGVFSRPAGGTGRRFPAVLFLHGLPGAEKNVDVQRALLRKGVASFSLHFSGAWGSEGFYRVSGLVDDARAALRHLRARGDVDPARVAVFGFSMGGWTAIHLGAREKSLKAVVAVAPAGGREMVKKQLRAGLGHLSQAVRVRSRASFYRDFVAAVTAHDPAQSAARLRCPLLVIHGEKDSVVPPSTSERIIAAAPEPKRLIKVPSARHDLLERREWLARTAAAWLCAKLG